jgi:glucose-6-phosphate isomerase
MADSLLTFDPSFLIVDEKHPTSDQSIPISAVEKKITDKEYGFITVLAEKKYLQQVEKVFAEISWAETLVVIGIGGSDLGARAIQNALEGEHPPMKVIFHGDSTDPEAITRLFRQINLEKTVFVIISKSGQTVETISQYIFLKKYLGDHIEEWTKHFVFVTDPKSGVLRAEGEQNKVAMLPIPPSVGGRFSVLTPVGLLAAKAMGVDIEALVSGAELAAANDNFRTQVQKFAATQFQLYQQGTKLVAMMPYAVQLDEFCRWFRQLWAESLGKAGKGVLPLQARGPADQHSQLQFYSQGEMLTSLLFLRVESRNQDYKIEGVDIESGKYLEGHSFQEIVNIEQEATALALKKIGRPSAVLKIKQINATSLGQLFMFFELGVVYLAEMMGVNAFDQPGVEESKQMIYALLDREEYADKKQEIEALRSSAK